MLSYYRLIPQVLFAKQAKPVSRMTRVIPFRFDYKSLAISIVFFVIISACSFQTQAEIMSSQIIDQVDSNYKDQPSRITRQQHLDYEQGMDMTTFLVIFFALLVLVFAIGGVFYFEKLRKSKLPGKANESLGKIKYDSKMSLCSLIFDPLNSVLMIDYGKRKFQVSFANISAFEVLVNANCLLKIENNGHVFDAETEHNLFYALNSVDNEVLQHNATRQIELNIVSAVETDPHELIVNFYYREGNHRLSEHSFTQSVDDILLWCTLLESAIRPESDTQAFHAEEIVATENKEFKLVSEPAKQANIEKIKVQEILPEPAKQNNYDLAEELTRLADLRSQGLLSEEEFQKAKNKTLN